MYFLIFSFMKRFLPVFIASAIIVLALGMGALAAAPTAFTDQDSFASWYAPSVISMQNSGVISGYPDGSFQADNLVSRAELVVMLDRFSKNVVGPTVTDEPVAEPVVCTMQYVSGLELVVQDQQGYALPGVTITSEPETEFTEGYLGSYSGIGEGEGYYTYTVSKDGYSVYKETIKLEHDDCHVIPQYRTVTLYSQPAA